MKKIHYIHFGYPKTGTSWLYENLINHPAVDFVGMKENDYLTRVGYPVTGYTDYYKNFDISFNFDPNTWNLESKQLAELDNFATHYAISLRNPYDVANSLYNFLPDIDILNKSSYVSDLIKINFFDYAQVIGRLNNHLKKSLFVLYYDDLVCDSTQYYNSLLDHLGLPLTSQIIVGHVGATEYKDNIKFTDKEIEIINGQIDQASEYLKKDLTKWKR